MADRVLDYGDILLRKLDVDLLRGPYWLNDQIMSFYFTFLGEEKYCASNVTFCGGSLSYLLLKVGDSDAAAIAEPLKLNQKELVFLAVNDNPDTDTPNGGSHWSLLVFSKQDSTFRHLDSAGGMNDSSAKVLASRIQSVLGLKGAPIFQEPEYVDQQNGCDCGVYATAASDLICGEYTSGKPWQDILQLLRMELTAERIVEWRSNLLLLIEQKSKV